MNLSPEIISKNTVSINSELLVWNKFRKISTDLLVNKKNDIPNSFSQMYHLSLNLLLSGENYS